MGFWEWFSDNAFNLISNVGVIISLCFTASALRAEAKARRESNLLAATANHREVWGIYLENRDVRRVMNATVNLSVQPVTDEERIFVNMVIQQLNSVYRAIGDHLFVKLEGLRRDVSQFFSLPIPRDVWEKVKNKQNVDFVVFVDNCLNLK